ncbi:hypothetical protein FKP32DRAFT_884101 [Trametes sanguinea]|nr:hypothetical protein FKP32DRAFT_884101 [Trametes sanguinea]
MNICFRCFDLSSSRRRRSQSDPRCGVILRHARHRPWTLTGPTKMTGVEEDQGTQPSTYKAACPRCSGFGRTEWIAIATDTAAWRSPCENIRSRARQNNSCSKQHSGSAQHGSSRHHPDSAFVHQGRSSTLSFSPPPPPPHRVSSGSTTTSAMSSSQMGSHR